MTPWTAWVTALPPYSSFPSRRSTASNAPVEAPLGAAARPSVPSSSDHLGLKGRVAPGVQDLPGEDRFDGSHG